MVEVKGARWARVLPTLHGAFIWLLCAPAPIAQAQLPGVNEWAEAVVGEREPSSRAIRVPLPEERPRPTSMGVVRSVQQPLNVHVGTGVAPALAEEALDALEETRSFMLAGGWPDIVSDGGRGSTDGFDLYLVHHTENPADAYSDGPNVWSHFDAVSSYGVVGADVSPDALAAHVAFAYAQGVLLAWDPGEARTWRRATAAWIAWQLYGLPNAVSNSEPTNAIIEQQQAPWRSWIDTAAHEGAGGALLLGMLAERHGSAFVRSLWEMTPQRSKSNAVLLAAPHLWLVLSSALARAGETLQDEIVELAIARYFAGPTERARNAPMPLLRELPTQAAVPIASEIAYADLPRRTRIAEPSLQPFGSRYTMIDVRDAHAGEQLRVWLRGEFGVKWSLVAVRLGQDGRELGRISAPERRLPESYVPVELLEGTTHVLLVVTNLSSRLPNASLPDENERSFTLSITR